MNSGKGRNFVAGFFVGAAMGAVGALLLAPMTGKKLRRDLTREGRRMAHRVTEAAEELRDRSKDIYESSAEIASDAKQALRGVARKVS